LIGDLPQKQTSMIEQIETELLPQALAIGVDYNLFWELNPKTITPFTNAFSIRQDIEDDNSWKQGKYIEIAIASVLSGGKTKYPKTPFYKMKNLDQTQDDIKNKFIAHAKLLNKKFERGV